MRVSNDQSIQTGALLFVSLILIGLVALYAAPRPDSVFFVDDDVENTAETGQPALPSRIESRFMLFGDVMWGRNNQQLAERNGGPSYLFDSLASFDRDKYDAWIINLECPVTDTVIPMSEQENLLRFNCPPSYLREARKWFDIAGLANNHTDNVEGEAGLQETRERLDAVNMQYFGHYDGDVADDICEVVALPVRIFDSDSVQVAGSLPVALCGYHGVFKIPTDSQIAEMQAYSDLMPTIAMVHMGAEYEPRSDSLRQRVYRSMVDNGADLVVGGHPHWVQETEVYNDTLIVYSVGNFLFDQSWSSEVKRGIGLDVAFSVAYDENLGQWLEVGNDCTQFKDECLTMAASQELIKIPLDFEYDIVASQYENGQTRRADPAIYQELLERTNWQATKGLLAKTKVSE